MVKGTGNSRTRGTAAPRKKTLAGKAATWRVPAAVPRSEVRAHLAAIVRHVGAGNVVHVGTSQENAYSVFIPLDELKAKRAQFRNAPEDIDIERLRSRWSSEREHVENTGGPLRILRNGEPVAALIPTSRALAKKVKRTVTTLDKAHVQLLADLDQRVGRIEAGIQAVTEQFLDGQEVPNFRQIIGIARVVLEEWRASKGLSAKVPDNPHPH